MAREPVPALATLRESVVSARSLSPRGLKIAVNNFTPAKELLAVCKPVFQTFSPENRLPLAHPERGRWEQHGTRADSSNRLLKPLCRTLTDACAGKRFAVYEEYFQNRMCPV